jgi:integrase
MKASDKEDRKSAVGPKAAHRRSEKPFNRTDGPVKLNSDLVKGVPAPTRGSITLWDTELGGFGIRIFAPTERHPKGARSFFLNYRVDGRECRYTIGAFPTWSVTAAREEAKELRKRVDCGENPAAVKRARREAPTVQDLIDRYLTEHLHLPVDPPGEGAVREHPRLNDQRRVLAEIAVRLGKDRRVADVHFGDMQTMHRRITESGRPVRANRILGIASKAFSLSLRPMAGEVEAWRNAEQGNPCKGVARNPEEAKERFLSAAELAALSDALQAYSVRAKSSADCVRFIMLTGCRPLEAMQARWEQFDAEPGFWVKPSAHTKQRKVHKAPLAPAALELIERLRKEHRGTTRKGAHTTSWVFPGQVPGEPLKQLWSVWYWCREQATLALWATSEDDQITGMISELRSAFGRDLSVRECQTEAERRGLKLPTGLLDARIYDLRHTFASIGAGGGLSLQIIGRLLGHTQARTTQRYAHLADDPLREAADKIGAVIAGAGMASAKVVDLKKGRL